MATATLRMTSMGLSGANSHYGWRKIRSGGRWINNYHEGMDCPFGPTVPISAWGSGTVVASAQGSKHWEYGWYIRIRHASGIETSYHSMNRPSPYRVGQWVAMGATVGYGGMSALGASGFHCHFGLWVNGKHKDPQRYLKPGALVKLTVNPFGMISSTGAVPFPNTPSKPSKPAVTPPSDAVTPEKRKKSMTNLAYIPASGSKPQRFLQYGPNFYLEFVGQEAANALNSQIGGKSIPSTESFFAAVKRAVDANRTNVTVTLSDVDEKALAEAIAAMLPKASGLTKEDVVDAIKSVSFSTKAD